MITKKRAKRADFFPKLLQNYYKMVPKKVYLPDFRGEARAGCAPWIRLCVHSLTYLHVSRILGQWVMVKLRGVEWYQFSRVLEGGGVEYALSETRFLHDLMNKIMSMSFVLKPTFRSRLIQLFRRIKWF